MGKEKKLYDVYVELHYQVDLEAVTEEEARDKAFKWVLANSDSFEHHEIDVKEY